MASPVPLPAKGCGGLPVRFACHAAYGLGLREACRGVKCKYGERALRHLALGRLPKAKQGWKLRHMGSVASLQRGVGEGGDCGGVEAGGECGEGADVLVACVGVDAPFGSLGRASCHRAGWRRSKAAWEPSETKAWG